MLPGFGDAVKERAVAVSVTEMTMDKTSIGTRMKRYELVCRHKLTPRTPAIIRVDGKAFHTLTKGCNKPFDEGIGNAMDSAAVALMSEVQNARLAYVQSDEISILMIDYNTLYSQPWYDGTIEKICSVAASVASVAFTLTYAQYTVQEDGKVRVPAIKRALFDARVFCLPESEVCNYFIFRQQDATRNAIQMVGQTYFSHKQLHGKSCDDIQELMFQKGINFNDYSPYWKRGRVVDLPGPARTDDIPIFSQDRSFIEKYLTVEES